MAVHLLLSTHERRKWLTSRGHKMAVRPWSVPYRTQWIQGRSPKKLSSYQSLAVHRNSGLRAVCGVCFVSQVVQPLTTPVTFFSVEIDGAKEPRKRCLRGAGARLSTSRIQKASLKNLGVHLQCKLPKSFKILCPVCTCGERGQRDREGRSPGLGRHRYSLHTPYVEGSPWHVGVIFHYTNKDSLCFVPRSLYWV